MLKRERLTNDELVPLKRLHGFLKERNLREEQIEQLIDEFDTHFSKGKWSLRRNMLTPLSIYP